MYLKLKKKDINEIPKQIFTNCPYGFSKKDIKKVFACKNCKDAPCLHACKKGAIYFSSKGIISIDPDKCDGCGECVKACKENAIILKNNKAYKCDLCSQISFAMYCYKNYPEFLELVDNQSIDDSLEIINKNLGFKIIEHKDILRNLSKNVYEKKDSSKIYLFKQNILSVDEIEIINSVLDNYKENNKDLKDISAIKIKEDLEKELIDFCFINSLELDSDQFNYILETIFNILYKYGPLSEALDDYDLEEIVILDINKEIYVYHKYYGWLISNLVYLSKDLLRELINKLSWSSNKFITLKNPILNTYLEDNSRMNAVISPITNNVSITIRKFSEKPFTLKDLISTKTISLEALAFLRLCFLTDSNILVVGNTGSGKTTTLNTLLNFIPSTERFIVVEDVREINFKATHVVNLLVNEDLSVTLSDLVINTLRMRPDRVIIGEIRSKTEVISFMESILCGQAKGTYSTFHSNSSLESIRRIMSYGILESDLLSLDIIINQKRFNKYTQEGYKDIRKIIEICEVVDKNGKIFLNILYKYNIFKDVLEKINNPIKLMNKFKFSFGIKNIKEYDKLFKDSCKFIENEL
ncbi:MAG: ATPase, T2SS/T4P/T4SS family [Candidatus ainarchaeum sp.]|nr:ATPase, T2SS/T4P/T4SS family [Candidatus ainarchaeum sp.]MDD3975940.1 ATPase, T2SS/T4P/T4SS family [Candidatus ainarchaeum sp.]